MTSHTLQPLFRAVLGGFLIGSSLIGHAQDNSTVGVVRITDARPRGVPVQNAGFSHKVKGDYQSFSGGYGYGCPHCNGGGCPQCNGGCPSGHGKHCHLGHCLHGKFREHYCSHSPDYGFAIPGKNPIYRRGVQYNQYFPSGWYGTANGGIAAGMTYPTIYQPTDTTQLGFYYQHVPFWQPNPNALPPRPIPAQWHSLTPVAHKHWNGAGWGGGYCPPGNAGWVDGGTTNATPTPMPADGQPTTPQAPSATDQPPMPVPQEDAPAPNDAAQGLQIRRANYQE